jgi:hypothetical protein
MVAKASMTWPSRHMSVIAVASRRITSLYTTSRALEGWLHQWTLAPMTLAVAGPQAVAQHIAQLVDQRTSLIEGHVVAQDLPDKLRVGSDVRPLAAEPYLHQVRLSAQGDEELQRPIAHLQPVPQQRQGTGCLGDREH